MATQNDFALRPYFFIPKRRAFMTYVDGFVVAVQTGNRETYRKHAEGKLTSFPMAVKRKDDETVVFSWVVWPSRQIRDEGMKAVMADPRLQPDTNAMPFDGKRMIYGGFEVIVDA
jgi:uncharacterized protein YbaA (DUF1428 family)